MADVRVEMDDEISVCTGYEDYTIQSGDVTVVLTGDGWWKLIGEMQDWLGECPHCGKPHGEPVTKSAAPAVGPGDGLVGLCPSAQEPEDGNVRSTPPPSPRGRR